MGKVDRGDHTFEERLNGVFESFDGFGRTEGGGHPTSTAWPKWAILARRKAAQRKSFCSEKLDKNTGWQRLDKILAEIIF